MNNGKPYSYQIEQACNRESPVYAHSFLEWFIIESVINNIFQNNVFKIVI